LSEQASPALLSAERRILVRLIQHLVQIFILIRFMGGDAIIFIQPFTQINLGTAARAKGRMRGQSRGAALRAGRLLLAATGQICNFCGHADRARTMRKLGQVHTLKKTRG